MPEGFHETWEWITGKARRGPRKILNWNRSHIVSLLRMARCPICGGNELQPAACNFMYYHLRCPACDLAFVGNLPSMGEITSKYQDVYLDRRFKYLRIKENSDEEWNWWKQGRIENMLKLDIEKLENQLPQPRKVMEIGCAEGRQMELFIGRGWEATGTEVSEPLARIGKEAGLNILVEAISESTFGPKQFDLVIMSHVIEHLTEPLRILSICREVLKDSGWMIVETPATPEFWDTDHMFFFSQKSLDKMCEKAGFKKLKGFSFHRVGSGPNIMDYIAAYA